MTVPIVAAEWRLVWLTRATAVALGAGLVLSWRLWISSRLFPLSPVTDALPGVPYPLDYVWLVVLLGLLGAVAVIARPRSTILVCLALALGLALGDQTRWQPWCYQYLVMLAAVGVYGWSRPASALDACRLIIVGTYVWSGVQKLNLNFVTVTWPENAEPLLPSLPAPLILAIPVVEIAIGLGLLSRRLRRAALLLAVVTHLVVLAIFVAGGENTVIWPWNLAMIAFVAILFWRERASTAREIVVPRTVFHGLVLLLFGVLPALGLVDRWDSYLSCALYSGNTNQAAIHVSPAVVARLPAAIHPHVWRQSEPWFLDLNRWAYDELNVPLYPERRVYRKVAQRICAYAQDAPEVRLQILSRPGARDGRRASEYYECRDLR